MFYDAQNSVIKLFVDYSTITSEAKFKTIHGKVGPLDIATCTNASDISSDICTSKSR